MIFYISNNSFWPDYNYSEAATPGERRDGYTMYTVYTVLEDFSDSSVINAIEMNVHEAWLSFAHGFGAIVHDEPDLLWFLSGLPFHLTNGIVKAHFTADYLEDILDERLRLLTAEQVPMAWLIGPSTRPVDLGSHLEARGWVLEDVAPGMAIELQTLDESLSPPTSLTIERIHDEEGMRMWLRIMTVGSEDSRRGTHAPFGVGVQAWFQE